MSLGKVEPRSPAILIDPIENAAACAVSGDLAVMSKWVFNQEDWSRSEPERSKLAWRALPDRIICDGRERALNSEGRFIRQIALSVDGTLMGLEGGYQFDPINGQLNRCYFALSNGTWRKFACVQIAVS
jgi:hypothetical protein